MNKSWNNASETQQIPIGEPPIRRLSSQRQSEPPPPAPKRGPWYLLTGLILGLLVGLAYSLWIDPAVFGDMTPAQLAAEDRAAYRLLIAEAYAATENLDRAQRRLVLLEDADPVYALGAQAQRALAEGASAEARALALLASALQNTANPPAVTPIPTFTLPALTPVP
ncbi:hypothetical protein KQH50_00790 [bacterium]|nr:hypothetical protein [bacterium]